MDVRLSVIVPTLDGSVPVSLIRAVENRADVEVVVVKGVSPVGKARNEGLRRARGEYIAWVDADDEVSEDWSEEILNAIDKNSSCLPDVVTFDISCERCLKTTEWARWIHGGVCSGAELTRAIYRDCTLVNAVWMYVTRRALWKDLMFDESVVRGEDYLLLPQVMSRARVVRYLPKSLYCYRDNATSIMHQDRDDHQRQYLELSMRRFEEAPGPYLKAVRFGVACECYWLMNGVALGKNRSCPREVYLECRRWIRARVVKLVVQTILDRELSWRDRLVWSAKFVVAAIDCWWGLKAK